MCLSCPWAGGSFTFSKTRHVLIRAAARLQGPATSFVTQSQREAPMTPMPATEHQQRPVAAAAAARPRGGATGAADMPPTAQLRPGGRSVNRMSI